MNWPDEENGSVWEHIEALRTMLFRSIGTFVLLCVPAWFAAQPLLDYLLDNAVPQGITVHYFTVMEPFLTLIKLSGCVAFIASLPFTLFFVWQFVSPALLPDEKRAIGPMLIASLLLAYGGIALTYFLIIPKVIQFSMSFATDNLNPVLGIGSFVSLLLSLAVASAILFQFPILLFVLLSVGLVSTETLESKRSIIVVVILILAAILTPPDIISQLALAIPTWLLFELSIFVFHFYKRRDPSLKIYEEAENNSKP